MKEWKFHFRMHAGTCFANDVISACRKSGAAFTRFTFPTWWHYDVLRGLEYLRNVDVASDKRVAEAIELLNQNVTGMAGGHSRSSIPA